MTDSIDWIKECPYIYLLYLVLVAEQCNGCDRFGKGIAYETEPKSRLGLLSLRGISWILTKMGHFGAFSGFAFLEKIACTYINFER